MTVRTASRMDEGRYVLITGASSGIGAELAWLYAARGRPLVLWGRNAERLENVAARARGCGVDVHTRVLDVADGPAPIAALRADDDSQPIGLAFLAAGRGDQRRGDAVVERAEEVLRRGWSIMPRQRPWPRPRPSAWSRAGGGISC